MNLDGRMIPLTRLSDWIVVLIAEAGHFIPMIPRCFTRRRRKPLIYARRSDGATRFVLRWRCQSHTSFGHQADRNPPAMETDYSSATILIQALCWTWWV